MTGPGGGKITAQSYATNSSAGVAQSPLDWGDKCFLCSSKINIDTPPVDSREFYVSPRTGKMMLCHSACVDLMNRSGGTPADFHRARQEQGKSSVEPTPEPEPVKEPVREQGAAWLHFEKLSDYNAYVVKHGTIEDHVKVTVGNQLLQAGE